MKRSDFRFLERLRVRWAEIDQQRIVFNGHYLMYFDTAITGYWRALALPYSQTLQALDGDLFVRKATLEYLGSGRLDDLLDIGIRNARIGNSSMTFEAAVFRNEELLVSGELVYVFADPQTQRSKPVPPSLREVLQAFEAGEAMVQVRLGSWNELGGHAQALRTDVFVQEQKVPAELEWDAADAQALHAVAFNRFGVPLATGRLLAHAPGVARIGRMAVTATLRGSRVGRQVLEALVHAARDRGERELVLNAQVSAAPFYSRAGFAERGPVFEEAGIPHVEMMRSL
ncbi:MAG TPA: YbgC/FadM family acyl-CoA thioesterase [Albitalea sp.]|uniref:YbgC/FadM family acyl-CoA thioesterase n=1 Tax=Piscinibacter sp. TaxID=1903157 RepID=UPI002ED6708C